MAHVSSFCDFARKRSLGAASKYHWGLPCTNYRITNMQAAIGLEQVKKMDRVIAKRNENAGYLTQRLKVVPGVETPEEPPWGERVYYYYPSLEVNTSMVLFIMIDGLRPDAVAPAHCPHLATTLAKGASTLGATSVMPSITLPCHMSIFHSVPPTRHGVTTNEWSPMARPLPGLVDVARAAGLHCAFFYNWEPLRNLSQPGSLSFAYFRDNVETPEGDQAIAEVAARTMAADRPDFAFVYFGTVDTAGHAYGWLSDGYLAQLAKVDRALNVVLQSVPDDGHVLIQSDHGGHARSHGTHSADDMTIPWTVAGPSIRPNHTLAAPVSLLDTAPTLARLLNIAPHPQWEGRCVEEAFQ